MVPGLYCRLQEGSLDWGTLQEAKRASEMRWSMKIQVCGRQRRAESR